MLQAPFFKQYFQYVFNYQRAFETLQQVREMGLVPLEEFLEVRCGVLLCLLYPRSICFLVTLLCGVYFCC